ncbi:hypothetical protein KC332_g883 [Hortaea werneckii]|nr:hypothetical protein KC350_g13430 [Hortaea werneckii]KAI6850176.1 hypothetical protein KC358_g830 [Hortaea werneckii]KAI6943111.1 hypothetical protein KC341_g1693 [Hortaea werneckii]KAI6948928.1 hypothetical protein KC348_g1665 [Hortaea werneckii]KAI6974993.1 hypothetical protein KC329_g11717 [Hortaea werneckii]
MADKDKELLALQIKMAELETELRIVKELLAEAQNATVHTAAAFSQHQSNNNNSSLKAQEERAQMAEKENVELKGIVRYLQTEMAKSSQSIHTEGASKDASCGSRNATHTSNSSTDDSSGPSFNIEGDLLSFNDDDVAAATGKVADATRLKQRLEAPEMQTLVPTVTNGRNGDADRYERAPFNDSGLSDEASQPLEPDPVFGMPSDRKKIFNADGSISWMEVYPDPPVSRPVDSYWRKPKLAQGGRWGKVNHYEWRQLVNMGMYVQQWDEAQWEEWAHEHGRYGAAEWRLYWEEQCKAKFEEVTKQRKAAGISGEETEEVEDRVDDDAHDFSSKETETDEHRTVSQHAKDDGNGSKDSSLDYAGVAHDLAATIQTPKGSKEEGSEVGGMSDTITMPFRIAGEGETKKGNLVNTDSLLKTPEVSVVEDASASGVLACKDTKEAMPGKNPMISTAFIQPRQGQASAPADMALGHALDHYSTPMSLPPARALPNAHPDLPADARRAVFSQSPLWHPCRTAEIKKIPPEIPLTTVLEKVRGGKVMRSVLIGTSVMKSTPFMEGNVALIQFMDGPNAEAYVAECAEIQGIFFWSEQENAHVKAEVSVCPTPSSTCPGFLVDPKADFTRIVYLADNGVFAPELVVGAVLKVYNHSREGRRSPGAPLRMGRNKDSNSLIMEWALLRDAYNAKNALDKMQWLIGGSDVGFLPDPCAGSVETLEEVALARDPATVPSNDCPIMWLPPSSEAACLAEADKAFSARNSDYFWRDPQNQGHQFAAGIAETVGMLDAELMTEQGPIKGRKPFWR